MAQQQEATFAAALRQALIEARRTQAWLAETLPVNRAQVSRWTNGKAVPHIETVQAIEELVGADLKEAYQRSVRVPESPPDYELFVSAPFSGLSPADIVAHRRDVSRVVDAAKEVVDGVYWPSMSIASINERGAPDLATESNLDAFERCRAYLYLQFGEIVNPSGALVELGFALGRRLKTTMIIMKNLSVPYMFEGLQGVAARLRFLPEVHIYVVDDVDRAVQLIERDGSRLLLPD
jgi:DNA-binding XRE family transcriptional regulator